MSDRYQAFLCNHVWVVIDNHSKEEAAGPFVSEQEADRAILELWRQDKPGSLESPAMVWGDDWEGRLLAILDKPYELEFQEAA